jgi:PmbA protein
MDDSLPQDLVQLAMAQGADAAEAVYASRQVQSVSVRDNELEEVEREESRDLGLRVFVGSRQANVSGSAVSRDALMRMAERAVAMAKLAPEDPYAGLAPQDRLSGQAQRPDLDLYDPTEAGPEFLEEQAAIADHAARQVAGVTNTDGGSASWSFGAWTLATSHGFVGHHQASAFSVSASAIAGEGAGMERGGEGRSARHLSDLPKADQMGSEAGQKAVERLNPRKLGSTRAPVIFDNRMSMSMIGPLIGAISGPSVARGVSFLKDHLGKQIFSQDVTLTDDPHRVRGLGSSPFDDEGVVNRKWDLIDKGVLTTWLLNSASARQLGMETTGHASRGLAGVPGVSPSNLTLQPGSQSRSELMSAAGTGLLLTSMFGPSLNANTGDWSVGCSGMWFENGEVLYPVSEITVAGNLIEMYQRLIPANDLVFRGASNAPSILIDDLAIAGR